MNPEKEYTGIVIDEASDELLAIVGSASYGKRIPPVDGPVYRTRYNDDEPRRLDKWEQAELKRRNKVAKNRKRNKAARKARHK